MLDSIHSTSNTVRINNNNAKTTGRLSQTGLFSAVLKLKEPLRQDTISFKGRFLDKAYTEKMNQIPDFKQLSPEFPDNGVYYCGPVSCSNALLYLSKNGYPRLCENKTRIELIKELARLFKTNSDSGSVVQKVCEGLDKYITDKGYKIKRLEFQGFRPVEKYHSGVTPPDLNQIKKAIEKKGLVMLYMGEHKPPVTENGKTIYQRNDGHWVTLVGHSFDGTKYDPNCLIVHDPYAKSNSKINNNFLKLVEIPEGELRMASGDRESMDPQDAKGYYKVTEGIEYSDPAKETIILNGAIILELED